MPAIPDVPTVAVLQDVIAAKDAEIADLQRQLEHWRAKSIVGWSTVAGAPGQAVRLAHVEGELAAMRQTVSWRVTAPLRSARRVRSGLGTIVRAVRGR